ncbi:MAG: glycosyltransferase family 4 protein [Nanoarchaeota archaeon]|nr:glycosyltransferase family 4 protein [Nanoarchaeota archaeon]
MKLKIAFVCIYSKGACGVWTRVSQMSEALAKKGFEVHVFSTNKVKGTEGVAKDYEVYNNVSIHRFQSFLSIGRNINLWFFYKKLKKINPDIIIAEVYRHPHTLFALKAAKKLKKPVFLVTHAPFVEKEMRGKIGNTVQKIYDTFVGKKILESFDEIITITKWEVPFLRRLGIRKKLNYIPNGIPEEFFKTRIKFKNPRKILYFGRISPIKNLETLIHTISLIENKNIKVEIIGPPEKEYVQKLKILMQEKKLQNMIKISPPIFDLKKKIKEIDNFDIFVLPSKREAMPQALMELMALGKIVIASNTKGAKEIILDKKNGFLFKIGNEEDLKNNILFCLNKENFPKIKEIQVNARKSVEQYSLNKLVLKLEKLIKKHLK